MDYNKKLEERVHELEIALEEALRANESLTKIIQEKWDNAVNDVKDQVEIAYKNKVYKLTNSSKAMKEFEQWQDARNEQYYNKGVLNGI